MNSILTVIGLVVAVAALVIAGLAARYTRQQAEVARGVLHDSRTPVLAPRLELRQNGQPHWLHLKLLAGPDLDSLEIEVIYRQNESVPIPRLGVGVQADHGRAELGAVQLGDTVRVRADISSSDARNPAEFRATCRAGGEAWIVPFDVVVQWAPGIW